MYIDKLELTNIASLRGSHTIDFKDALAKEGLFAITGPTGSGKSTLLSAISLALYGQGGKKGLSAKDYVSEGAPHGEVTLYLRLGEVSYKAFWSCSVLKKDGSARSKPTTKSYIEDLTHGEVLAVNGAELTKLTLDQFNQCVILHQGEFAKFLASTFSERRAILEKLINVAELEGIKEAYQSRHSALSQEIATLKERIDASELFGADEVAHLKEQKRNLDQLVDEYSKQAQKLAKIEQLFIKIKEYSQAREQSTLKRELSAKQLEEFTQAYQAQYLHYKTLEDQSSAREKAWNIEREQASKALALKQKIATSKELLEALTRERQAQLEREHELSLQIKNKAAEIEALQFEYPLDLLAELAAQAQQILKEMKELHHLAQSKLEAQKNIEVYDLNLAEIQQAASTIKERYQVPIVELLASKKELQQQLAFEYKNLEQQINGLQTLQLQLEALTKQQTLIRTKANALTGALAKELTSESLREMIKQKRDIFEREKQLAAHFEAILKLREMTIERDQCQLCGHDHPQLAPLDIKGPASAQVLEQFKSEIEQLEATLSERQLKEAELYTLTENLKHLTDEYQLLVKNYFKTLVSVEHIHQELNQLQDNLKIKAEQKEALEQEYILLTKDEQKLNSLREQYQKTSGLLKESKQKLQQAFERDLTLRATRVLYAELPTDSSAISDYRDRINSNISRLEKKSLFEQTLSQFEAESLRLKSSLKDKQQLLEQRQSQIEELELNIPPEYRETDLLHYIEAQDSQLKSDKQALWDHNRALNEKKLACERAKEALSHVEQNIQSAQEWILKLQEDLALELMQIKSDASSSLISSELLERPVENQGEFSQMSSEMIAQIIEHSITPWIEDFRSNFEDKKQLHAQVKSKLELHHLREEQNKIVALTLKEKQKTFELMQNMRDFFWKNDFKNYVLSMIEDELIIVTNQELQKLCEGRYYLKSRPGVNGPEFVVSDHWISLSERKVASLSGGETFMVSLALALGLAELTRGKTQIDSFFIDEGFGTLDEQTLESVGDVLLNLKGRGKVIGIISHVEALTTRLPRSLKLHKQSAGSSTLSYQELIN